MESLRLSSRQSEEYDIWNMQFLPQRIGDKYFKLSDLATVEKGQMPQQIAKINQQYRLCLQYEYIGSSNQGQKIQKNIVKDFQTNPETMVFLAQIDTAGLGITLTAADTCVYYSVNFNYAAYSQSLARIHRIGQKNACTYIHLITEGTIDEVVLKALAKKEDLAKTVVDTWRDYF